MLEGRPAGSRSSGASTDLVPIVGGAPAAIGDVLVDDVMRDVTLEPSTAHRVTRPVSSATTSAGVAASAVAPASVSSASPPYPQRTPIESMPWTWAPCTS